ncbi:hypothetical protein OsccyDRAFT_4247 [Leptolyngbyaceae cyanobacterium JSC-12]|nr:hypothetical protein OsccyDRAFT_4247 [Leptolyngbyaceae cyanobacterium JSC-12]
MEILAPILEFLAGLAPWILFLLLLAGAAGLAFIWVRVLILKNFFDQIGNLFKDVFALVVPKKWDSAKTLILLGGFSWFMSLLVGSVAQSIIAFVGWIFLIAGIHWVMHEEKGLKEILTINGFFIGPWITGALICYFLFGTRDGVPPIAYILWAPLSAVIAGIPKFIGTDSVLKTPIWVKPKPGDRQYLINLALINLLISCWLQLGLTTRQWLADYPTMQFDDFSSSAFVINLQPNNGASSRGVQVLNQAEAELKANLQGQSWSQVERWLLNFDTQLRLLEEDVFKRLPKTRENDYWTIFGKILPGEYNIQLISHWQGPSSNASGFHYTKTCKISRVAPMDVSGQLGNQGSTLPQVGNAKVECGQVEGPVKGEPEAQL